ncbi:MAG: 2-amino-4-hydroxy-6-hydroxymethyldihydropteridine diphosphokinase [Fimbriimonadales bacterium]|nr:MAG: 2-amino-4-hydroxy-6-hydroxymethyldihydropteridine diphosphokinase [Fimbriimonadales bacterium]GIV11510.1 MAG: 2-amino-4-hydroxy-6-hydroxymethyldihydropteridine diphosphokinase [Fimbriimonadales bacterium]
MAAKVYLSLGSNLGDRLQNLQKGIAHLSQHGIYPIQISQVYETEPVGATPDPRPYLNLGVWAETTLAPQALLCALKAVESAQGRTFREGRWMPRPLDIDIILYDDLLLNTPTLTIPHPRMRERAFVLIPLAEMTPDYTLPDGTPLQELLQDPRIREQEVRYYDVHLSVSSR